MKHVDINDVDLYESFFHFTLRSNIESIEANGLKAGIGDTTKLVNGNSRVYLSKGAKGILGIKNSFIYKFKQIPISEIPQGYRKYFDTIQDFSSSELLTPEQVYEALASRMKDEIYLVVDAKEGEDIFPEDNEHWGSDYDVNGIENHDIESKKLSILMANGEDTVLDIVLYLYSRLLENGKKRGKEDAVKSVLFSLNGFFEYLQQKDKKSGFKVIDDEVEITD